MLVIWLQGLNVVMGSCCICFFMVVRMGLIGLNQYSFERPNYIAIPGFNHPLQPLSKLQEPKKKKVRAKQLAATCGTVTVNG